MTKMSPEFKARWVAALRSGEYKQGRYALRNGANEFCCLGVACDLLVKDKVVPKWTPRYGHNGEPINYSMDGCEGSLPPAAREALGLDPLGRLDVGALAFFNDDGDSFAQIADIIEQKL